MKNTLQALVKTPARGSLSTPLQTRLTKVCVAAITIAALAGSHSAQAATHTLNSPTNPTTNTWAGGVWTPAGAPINAAGDVAISQGSNTMTTSLDTDVTIGAVRNGGGSNKPWTITAGGGSFTLDGTGLTSNLFGNANTADISTIGIGGGLLTINPSISLATNIDIGVNAGTSGTAGVTIAGAITAANAASLTFRSLASGASGAITLSNSVGASGSNISISNLSTANGAVIISGALGPAVTGVTQNSTTSALTLSGANTYSSATLISAGTLTLGGTGTLNTASSITDNGVFAINRTVNTVQGTDFASVISGTGSVTFASSATNLTLNGNNTYQGGTTFSSGSGVLNINSATALGTGALTTTQSLQIDNTSGAAIILANNNALNLTGGSLTFTGTNSLSFGTGAVSLGNPGAGSNRTFTVNGSTLSTLTLNGNITQTGTNNGITKAGVGFLVLGGTNAYTGKTITNTGTLLFSKTASLYGGSSASWIPANITVANAATIALSVGGAGEFSVSDVDTLLGNISVTSSTSTGLQNGARIGFDTTNASGGSFTQGNVFANSTGTNGGAIGLTKLGTGILVLDKTNTYTGTTVVNGGTLKFGINQAFVAGSSPIINATAASGSATLDLAGTTETLNGVTFGSATAGAGGAGAINSLVLGSSGATGTVSFNNNISYNAINNPGAATISGGGSIVLLSSPRTFTIGDSTATTNELTISANITSGGLTKAGTGTMTLSGANNNGAITVNAGTLAIDSAGSTTARLSSSAITVNAAGTLLITNSSATASTDRVGNTAAVSLAGGTLASANSSQEGVAATRTGGTVTGTSLVGLGALTLTVANSTLDFDSATDGNLFVFNSFTDVSNTFKLNITNYTNSNFDGTNSGLSTDDRLVFKQDMSAFITAGDFTFNGSSAGVTQLQLDSGYYEIGVPVPEPSTWVAGILILGSLAGTQRRRLRAAAKAGIV